MATEHDVKYILAIDHGTSGMKPAIVSTDGKIIGSEFEPTPLYLSAGGGAEQSPSEWWNAFLKSSKRLIDRRLVDAEDIVGVCNSSQWSGTVAVDSKGEQLTNAIIWMDTRGAPCVERCFKGRVKVAGYPVLDVLRWLRKTGGIASHSGKDSIAHILYLKYEEPDIYREARWFLEPTDFMNLKLTGVPAASYASVMIHWVTNTCKINRIRYDDALIRRVGIDKAKLPPLMQSTDVLGRLNAETADHLGLSRETKVVVGAPDLHSAIVGSGAVHDYQGHIYVGTSSWIICHVPFKKTDISHNIASLPSAYRVATS